jgi:hypothetical protein
MTDVYQKVREGHRFDLLERGFQSTTKRLCALVEDKCLNHFKKILKKREVQSTLDTFLTSPLAKRQRPATEEEETYLE